MQIRLAFAFFSLKQSLVRCIRPVTAAVIAVAAPITASAAANLQKPINLKCDALSAPIGLDTPQPQLSWQLQDDRFGAKQTAYQVEVATTSDLLLRDKADVWDSGRVTSDKSVGVDYG